MTAFAVILAALIGVVGGWFLSWFFPASDPGSTQTGVTYIGCVVIMVLLLATVAQGAA